MKQITINDKTYDIACNAFTRVQYKSIFGRGIFEDIKLLNDFSVKQEEVLKTLPEDATDEEKTNAVNLVMMENLDNFIDVIERIAYIMIYTANDKIGTFADWLKGIDKIDLSASWISEVTEYTVSCFC